MYNVKVFADFRLPSNASAPDGAFCTDLADLKERVSALFVNFSAFDTSSEPISAVHFLTYPMTWISHYVRSQYSGEDPVLTIDYKRTSVIDWADLFVTPGSERVLAAFHEAGLGNHAVTVTGNGGGDLYFATTLTFRMHSGFWAPFKRDKLDIFRFEAEALCDRYRNNYLRTGSQRRELTGRETQVLSLVAEGMTDDRIAEILGIGKWTVVSHLQSAKYKLGSANRASAVAVAISEGLIRLRKSI